MVCKEPFNYGIPLLKVIAGQTFFQFHFHKSGFRKKLPKGVQIVAFNPHCSGIYLRSFKTGVDAWVIPQETLINWPEVKTGLGGFQKSPNDSNIESVLITATVKN